MTNKSTQYYRKFTREYEFDGYTLSIINEWYNNEYEGTLRNTDIETTYHNTGYSIRFNVMRTPETKTSAKYTNIQIRVYDERGTLVKAIYTVMSLQEANILAAKMYHEHLTTRGISI